MPPAWLTSDQVKPLPRAWSGAWAGLLLLGALISFFLTYTVAKDDHDEEDVTPRRKSYVP